MCGKMLMTWFDFRGESLLESWGTAFLPDWQPPLIFVRIYFKISWALVILLEYMHKKFEINRTKIRVAVSREEKVVTHNSKSDLPVNK